MAENDRFLCARTIPAYGALRILHHSRAQARIRRPSMSLTHYRRKSCRICGGGPLRVFLELGPTPLANSFPASPEQFESEAFYPLDVAFCENCSLVQLVDVIDPEVLFRDYIYVSGTSDTMAAHHRE